MPTLLWVEAITGCGAYSKASNHDAHGAGPAPLPGAGSRRPLVTARPTRPETALRLGLFLRLLWTPLQSEVVRVLGRRWLRCRGPYQAHFLGGPCQAPQGTRLTGTHGPGRQPTRRPPSGRRSRRSRRARRGSRSSGSRRSSCSGTAAASPSTTAPGWPSRRTGPSATGCTTRKCSRGRSAAEVDTNRNAIGVRPPVCWILLKFAHNHRKEDPCGIAPSRASTAASRGVRALATSCRRQSSAAAYRLLWAFGSRRPVRLGHVRKGLARCLAHRASLRPHCEIGISSQFGGGALREAMGCQPARVQCRRRRL